MARRNETPPGCPPDVRRVRDQFEEWRRSRHGRERIPERLWRSAVRACEGGEHSPYRIARWLRVNDAALRDRIRRRVRRAGRRRTHPGQRFVEVVPTSPLPTTAAAEYLIKVDGAPIQDVAALARALAEPRERR